MRRETTLGDRCSGRLGLVTMLTLGLLSTIARPGRADEAVEPSPAAASAGEGEGQPPAAVPGVETTPAAAVEGAPGTAAIVPPAPLTASASPGAATPPLPAPSPGAEASPAAAPPPASPADSGGTDWPFIGGILSASAGVALLVVGHYAMFRVNDAVREDDLQGYRATVPEGESACDYARSGFDTGAAGVASPSQVVDRCDEAEALEIVRNVTLPVGVAATFVGLLLIGTSDTVNGVASEAEQAGSWRWRVALGPDGAAAAVALAW